MATKKKKVPAVKPIKTGIADMPATKMPKMKAVKAPKTPKVPLRGRMVSGGY